MHIDPYYNHTAALLGGKWITEGLYDRKFVAERSVGFDAWRAYILGVEDGVAKPPEWQEPETGIPRSRVHGTPVPPTPASVRTAGSCNLDPRKILFAFKKVNNVVPRIACLAARQALSRAERCAHPKPHVFDSGAAHEAEDPDREIRQVPRVAQGCGWRFSSLEEGARREELPG